MTRNKIPDYLEHMTKASQQARSYVEGLSRAEFLEDTRTQQAVIMNLVIIGEAATKLIKDHKDFIDSHREIPWAQMKGMRNRIAHGYFDINLDMVWETVQRALPELEPQLMAAQQGITPAADDDYQFTP